MNGPGRPSGRGKRTLRVLVAAGGTGGHLFPALSLAEALNARGHEVHLVTDDRGGHFDEGFPATAVHRVPAATPVTRSPVAAARALPTLARGVLAARRVIARAKPDVIVGFGGYPTVPPLLAAALMRVPSAVHEQNAVMGRANRMLAPRVNAIATGFPGVLNREPVLAVKATHTGNPVRPAVIEAAGTPYPPLDATATLHLLVFGGSQGARVMADIVPAAVARLEPRLQMRLRIVQQARGEDEPRVRDAYAKLNIAAEVAPFFADLPARMAASHLVVSRSGASTVAELAAIGRPAILVPLPHALDQDQRANAGMLMAAGGAIRLDQAEFTPDRLASEIAALAAEPARLARMAAAAKAAGSLDAADRLADLVLRVRRTPV